MDMVLSYAPIVGAKVREVASHAEARLTMVPNVLHRST
jgi:hypothetical protein